MTLTFAITYSKENRVAWVAEKVALVVGGAIRGYSDSELCVGCLRLTRQCGSESSPIDRFAIDQAYRAAP